MFLNLHSDVKIDLVSFNRKFGTVSVRIYYPSARLWARGSVSEVPGS